MPDFPGTTSIIGHVTRVSSFNRPGMEVCWLVTGIRQDAYAYPYRTAVEEDKLEAERGHYLHPELFGQPTSATVNGEK
jgi:hypothetical protein